MTTIAFDPFGSEIKDYIEISDREITPENDTIELNKEEPVVDDLNDLYYKDFDVQAVITSIPDMENQISETLIEVNRCVFPSITDANYESLCMDLIENIVRLNKKWARKDAIREAAKELVAVRKSKQSPLAEKVHLRVLHEFLIATDDEYLLLRKQLWKN